MTPPSATAGASTPTSSTPWDSSWPEWLKRSERNRLLDYLQERFGIPQSLFAGHHLLRRGPTIWLLGRDRHLPALASLRVESAGLPLLRLIKGHLKPTSAALQLFGPHARKNIVRLSPGQLKELVEMREIREEFPLSPGYVIVKVGELVVGCGLYVPGRLLSQFPRYLFSGQILDNLDTKVL